MTTTLGYVVVLLPVGHGDGSIVSSLSADRSDAESAITAWKAEVPAAVRAAARRPIVAAVVTDDPSVTG